MPETISTWPQFARQVRGKQEQLLLKLPEFNDPILITGCQRSGTTILTHILLDVPAVFDYRGRLDSELTGALMLAGRSLPGRHSPRACFQTTYLNENYREYYQYPNHFRLVYIVRNPFSVVYSMCRQWKRRTVLRNFALNELFKACGLDGLAENEKRRYGLLGSLGISRLRKACLAYVGKTTQLFDLKPRLGSRMLVVEYDELIRRKEEILPRIFQFLDLEYHDHFARKLHAGSLDKADRLSSGARRAVEKTCLEIYERAARLVEV